MNKGKDFVSEKVADLGSKALSYLNSPKVKQSVSKLSNDSSCNRLSKSSFKFSKNSDRLKTALPQSVEDTINFLLLVTVLQNYNDPGAPTA